MKRRDFGKLSMLGIAGGMVSCVGPKQLVQEKSGAHLTKIKPAKLKKGDTVGLVAPGSPFSSNVFEKAVKQITDLGLKIKYANNLHATYGYIAGTDEQRIDDLHQMFVDPEVKAVWCVRGGYGTTRLLPFLDYELIRKNPKLLIGYSDITALLNAIYQKTGLVGLHGPVAASTMTDYTASKFKKIIFENPEKITISKFDFEETHEAYKAEVIIPGKMKGELVGGNLSLLAAMAGTPFELDATDKLVFIEDVGEKPYRIDRMLTQLRQSANLDKASGILLGVFNDCEPKEGDFSLSLKQCLNDRLGDLGIPVYYGFSFGHIDHMCSLPVGIDASFDTETKELVLLERALE